jgi:drug/metabolite transporter (DMT)-like permease
MNRAEWSLLLALTALWSGSFLFAKVALTEVGPLTVVLARVSIGASALVGLRGLVGHRRLAAPALWPAFAVMALLNNVVPQTLLTWGMLHIDSGLASILNGTTPFFSVVLGHALGRERATMRRLAGVLVGFAGVVTIVGPTALRGVGTGGRGQLAVLGAAASYACAGLYGHRLRALSPAGAAGGMLSAAAFMMLPIASVGERPWEAVPGLRTALALLALGLVSTAAGYVVYFKILATAGPTNLLLVTLLMPIGGVVLGATVLDERVSAPSLAGMVLIAVGLAIVDGRIGRLSGATGRYRARTASRR